MNKLEASINLSGKTSEDEEVGIGIIMDGDSALMNIMLDGTWFADMHVNEDLKLKIGFSDLFGKTEHGEAITIDLRKMLELIETLMIKGVNPKNLELTFKVK